MCKKRIYDATQLATIFVTTLMLPILILAYTAKNPLSVTLVGVLLPLGAYTLFASISRHSGRMVWCGLTFIFFSSFQVVLSYLFGGSVVAADMFLNIITTNPSEATELLGNIYPAVIFVAIVYLPLLLLAALHIHKEIELRNSTRHRIYAIGAISLVVGCIVLIFGCRGDAWRVLRDEVFPINASYNLGLAVLEKYRIDHYEQTSEGFLYHAKHQPATDAREVYVLVIGEASRAANWQLYGYERATNPLLSQRDDIVLFRQITTQSNTTHKSVPMILSSVHTSEHRELYRRSGILALFNEAGFTTYFISNQQPQGAMIDKLANDANFTIYLDAPHYDAQLAEVMRKALTEDCSQKILFVLHTYGSHYSYRQRYPREFAVFLPDDDVAIEKANVDRIRNAYDNSILYTDFVLNEIISTLESYPEICSAMLYCADHGEDLFDTDEERFLHATPTVTYYQLHVASLAWFSEKYRSLFKEKAEAARYNENVPATTYSVFHTVADMASIASPYIDFEASLVSFGYDYTSERYYLNDHNKAVALNENIGIDSTQRRLFERAGVEL